MQLSLIPARFLEVRFARGRTAGVVHRLRQLKRSLCAFFRYDRLAQLPGQISARGFPRRGLRSAQYHSMPDQVLNPYPRLVLCSVRRSQCLLRRGGAPHLAASSTCRRGDFFNFEDDPRPGCLPRLCESWETPACFYPERPLPFPGPRCLIRQSWSLGTSQWPSASRRRAKFVDFLFPTLGWFSTMSL